MLCHHASPTLQLLREQVSTSLPGGGSEPPESDVGGAMAVAGGEGAGGCHQQALLNVQGFENCGTYESKYMTVRGSWVLFREQNMIISIIRGLIISKC